VAAVDAHRPAIRLGSIKSQLFAGSCMPKFRNMLVNLQFMPPVEGLIFDFLTGFFKEPRPYESVNKP
jgi:hypothetical protein